jgi:hypothetical protein
MLRVFSLTILAATALACTVDQSIGPPSGDVFAGGASPATQESVGVRLDEKRDVR